MTAKIDHELRMYFFVPYNLSPIQQGIQAGHAALEYAHKYYDSPVYENFVTRWKTFMIMNGGTTNCKMDMIANEFRGDLDKIRQELEINMIDCAAFFEPDLNDALSAVCFIADERVFNYDDYVPFVEWFKAQNIESNTKTYFDRQTLTPRSLDEDCQRLFPTYFHEWVKHLGGTKNYFLRTLLKGKKFA